MHLIKASNLWIYLVANFAAGEDGPRFAAALLDAITPADDLPTSADYLGDRSGGTMTAESKAYWSGGRSFDMRHVPGPIYLDVEGAPVPHQAVWIRPFDATRPRVRASPPV